MRACPHVQDAQVVAYFLQSALDALQHDIWHLTLESDSGFTLKGQASDCFRIEQARGVNYGDSLARSAV